LSEQVLTFRRNEIAAAAAKCSQNVLRPHDRKNAEREASTTYGLHTARSPTYLLRPSRVPAAGTSSARAAFFADSYNRSGAR
jgi:hypothetical protein